MFPRWDEDVIPPPPGIDPEWAGDLKVREEELLKAVKRGLGGKSTAPGPDGLHKKVIALVWRVLGGQFR